MNYAYPIITFGLFYLFTACTPEDSRDTTKAALFQKVAPSHSNVDFANDIIENDTLNYFNFPYLYMGGGVAIGDINGDDLPDIYFTGNHQANKLYLNKGDFTFEDISLSAGVQGDDRWYTGALMHDFNQDGWLDLYLCVSGKSGNTENQLFINNQDQTFTESAREYGLADKGHSIHATSIDYDRDGLMDLFVANYPLVPVSQGNLFYKELMDQNKPEDSGHLYRNTGKGTFEELSAEAGVQRFGLTLGLMAADFNGDGWDDLYLSNDFNVPDYLYINQKDGTFREQLQASMAQTSMFGMGIDAADFNRDGLLDLVQVDMTPEDHLRSKTNMASMSPRTFYEAIQLGFHHQYMQNSLQLNNGTDQGIPVFSNIARYAGLATTDWSWAPLMADLDNDGWMDLFITNGMKRDVNNNDVNQEFDNQSFFGNDLVLDINKLPSTPISNYAFQNINGLDFQKVTSEWGLDHPGFSNGLAYADLDADGQLDLVINNLSEAASIYKNTGNESRFLRVKLQGPSSNSSGIGAKVWLYSQGKIQYQQLNPSRGFQSSVEPILHFGLGAAAVDSLLVQWPDGNTQSLKNTPINQLLLLKHQESTAHKASSKAPQPWFEDITESANIDFLHQEDAYDDFQYEPLLPHRNSQMGPALAAADVNGDGLDDFYIGNGAGFSSQLYMQNTQGKFDLVEGPWQADSAYEDTGAIWLDADGDGDLDLYVVSGGNDNSKPGEFFQDRLYMQTAAGFIKHRHATLATRGISGQVVQPFDYEGDGDLDLFIPGRIVPGKYPNAAPSVFLINQGGQDQHLQYIALEESLGLGELGLVTDVQVEDFTGNGRQDLLLVGEWMNISLYENTPSGWVDLSADKGLKDSRGWWNCIQETDLDQDGKKDYIIGNLGLNYKYKTSKKSPFTIYANDFDENGSQDIVLSYEKKGKLLPVRGRECSSQQVPAIAKRFETYEAFANASLEEIYGKNMLENSLHYEVNTFRSIWLHRDDKGGFVLSDLPEAMQLSAIRTMVPLQLNSDQIMDYIAAGNLYQSEVETPRNDAGIGTVMVGQGDGSLEAIPASQTGLFIRGEVSNTASLNMAGGGKAIVFAINSGKCKVLKVIGER